MLRADIGDPAPEAGLPPTAAAIFLSTFNPSMDLADFLNLGALRNCDRVDERCIKESARCEREVKIGFWRADLRCGDVYVEVEPAERLACGLGQALLWRATEGAEVALVLYGSGEAERARAASLLVPTLYIDVELKIECVYLGGAGDCISFG